MAKNWPPPARLSARPGAGQRVRQRIGGEARPTLLAVGDDRRAGGLQVLDRVLDGRVLLLLERRLVDLALVVGRVGGLQRARAGQGADRLGRDARLGPRVVVAHRTCTPRRSGRSSLFGPRRTRWPLAGARGTPTTDRRSKNPRWCGRLRPVDDGRDRQTGLSQSTARRRRCQRRPAAAVPAGNLLLRAIFCPPTVGALAGAATTVADHHRGRPASVRADMGTSEPRRTARIDRKVDSGTPAGRAVPKDSEARERILTTAYGLFCRHGIGAVGVDTIIDQSGVAKMTLYRHFRSKDDLVLAVLERREELWTQGWLVAEVKRRASDPAERLLAIFDVFDGWFRRRSFEGCLFVNALLEIEDRKHADPPGQPRAAGPHPVLPRGPGARRRRARARALRPPVAHPHEGFDRGRGRGRRRRRAPGPGHGAAPPGPHARPARARRCRRWPSRDRAAGLRVRRRQLRTWHESDKTDRSVSS